MPIYSNPWIALTIARRRSACLQFSLRPSAARLRDVAGYFEGIGAHIDEAKSEMPRMGLLTFKNPQDGGIIVPIPPADAPDVAWLFNQAMEITLDAFFHGAFAAPKWFSWRQSLAESPNFITCVNLFREHSDELGFDFKFGDEDDSRQTIRDGCTILNKLILAEADLIDKKPSNGTGSKDAADYEKDAYLSFVLAVQENRGLEAQPLKKVHEWIKENGVQLLDGIYKPPPFDTWARYYRAGRKAHLG